MAIYNTYFDMVINKLTGGFMRDYIDEACETIDAALFSGDAFENTKERIELREYIERWNRQLDVLQKNQIDEDYS